MLDGFELIFKGVFIYITVFLLCLFQSDKLVERFEEEDRRDRVSGKLNSIALTQLTTII